jgi:hypothetical protein
MEGPDYKRQIDMWIKIMVIAAPFLTGAVSWGIMKATISGLDVKIADIQGDVREIKGWKDAQMEKSVATARENGEIITQLKYLNQQTSNPSVVNQLKDLNTKMGDVRTSVQKKLR